MRVGVGDASPLAGSIERGCRSETERVHGRRLLPHSVKNSGRNVVVGVYYAYLFQSLSDFRSAKFAYCMPKTHLGLDVPF